LVLALAIGVGGGPERMTDAVHLASGAGSRNGRWAQSLRRWEVGGAAMRADIAHELIAFSEARQGRKHGFRFRDPLDWKSCGPGRAIAATEQPLLTGDGFAAAFQLLRRNASGGAWAGVCLGSWCVDWRGHSRRAGCRAPVAGASAGGAVR
jgi:uncharacterized protein (TIGR02217 family)